MIYLGDCMDFMREQKDDTYDIIIADPPYETTGLKFDKDGVEWAPLSREMLRVLKPNGWFFVFGNLSVAMHFTADWKFKFDYIWVKTHHVIAPITVKRPWYKHENINAFINPGLEKMSDLYFDPDAISVEGPRIRHAPALYKKYSEFRHSQGIPTVGNKRIDTVVRHANTLLSGTNKTGMQYNERTEHPTQKPVSIYETLLLGYTPPRGLAFDPFGGSGTLAIAAMNTGRRYHLAELNPEYHSIIKDRVARHVPRLETARKQQSIMAHMEDDSI